MEFGIFDSDGCVRCAIGRTYSRAGCRELHAIESNRAIRIGNKKSKCGIAYFIGYDIPVAESQVPAF